MNECISILSAELKTEFTPFVRSCIELLCKKLKLTSKHLLPPNWIDVTMHVS